MSNGTICFAETDNITFTACFDSDQANALVRYKCMKCSNSITSTPDTSNNGIWELIAFLLELNLYFLPNDFLKVPDDSREWMGSSSRTEEIVCCSYIRCPITQAFVYSILQCA